MEIILNESAYAERILNDSSYYIKAFSDIVLLASYFKNNKHYSPAEVKGHLKEVITQHPCRFLPKVFDDIVESALRDADKWRVKDVGYISITENEMNAIAGVEKESYRKILFSLLCCSKYWNKVNQLNNNWSNTKESDLIKLANVYAITVRDRGKMFFDLKNDGYISFSKRVDNLNIRVDFVDDESPEVMRITDFRNLGNQYLAFFEGGYFKCKMCGAVIKKKSNSHKFCKECARKVKNINDKI